MSARLHKSEKQGPLLPMVLTICAAILATAPATYAQDPIRVETNQVIVPAFVGDKEHVNSLEMDAESMYRAVSAADTKRVDAILEWTVIRNLTSADFQVFEDGKEQTIQNVAYEPSLYWDLRDNRGHHTEYLGPGGGTYSAASEARAHSIPPRRLARSDAPGTELRVR